MVTQFWNLNDEGVLFNFENTAYIWQLLCSEDAHRS